MHSAINSLEQQATGGGEEFILLQAYEAPHHRQWLQVLGFGSGLASELELELKLELELELELESVKVVEV
eukprot:scaffold6385_cov207-Chaetoceros_neogracile.AAC.1